MQTTYLIGEIGQNHNGSPEIARQLIDMVSQPVVDKLFGTRLQPMDAVKLTKRDLAEELSASAMTRLYNNPHSFGKTYGEHRAFLELSDQQHWELFKYAKEKGLEFVETLCAPGCLSLLKFFSPDRLKVASRDLTNIPLLEALAETGIPIILSTGMGGCKELDNALEIICKHHDKIAVLHCLSQYPSEYQNINLKTIEWLQENYPQFTIGYSDHSIGIVVPVAAVALGAQIIEKHITLDREMKGTDHRGSLAPDGVSRMVRDIRNIENALGEKDMFISGTVKETRNKLERSVASKTNLKTGELLTEEQLHLLSPGDGYRWAERSKLVGRKLAVDVPKDEIIYPNMLQQ